MTRSGDTTKRARAARITLAKRCANSVGALVSVREPLRRSVMKGATRISPLMLALRFSRADSIVRGANVAVDSALTLFARLPVAGVILSALLGQYYRRHSSKNSKSLKQCLRIEVMLLGDIDLITRVQRHLLDR